MNVTAYSTDSQVPQFEKQRHSFDIFIFEETFNILLFPIYSKSKQMVKR
jgi:hypothetical protein